MRNVIVGLLAVAGATGAALGQVKLQLLANIDVSGAVAVGSPDRIGTNVAAVAWNGARLFIAGLNGSGAVLDTGIMEVQNPLSSPALGTRFATRSTNSSRGHTSLSIRGDELYAAWDNGAAALGGMARWDTNNTAAAVWQANIRGGGTDFDPGFAGSSPSAGNIGMALLGSGRRQLLDAGTGAAIYTGGGATAGFIFNNSPIGASVSPGSNHRDIAFNPANGDTFVRVANSIVRQTRTGDNSAINNTGQVIFENYGSGGQPTAANVNMQNIAFGYVNTDALGAMLFFNDRPATNTSGSITSTVKAVQLDGTPVSLDFGSFNITSTTGAFDFSWDQATNTLAISDFSNSRVYIFSVVPTPGAAALLGLGGLAALRRRR
jgi:MYXO-CTERM domain-containing protein